MAQYKSDNYSGQRMNSPYGNKSVAHASFADLSTASLVALDTLDLFTIPAGAKFLNGFMYSTALTTTATLCVGVRYADGTSTGGTTGTAVLVTTAITGATKSEFRFKPFTNDADVIAYITFISGPNPSAGDNLDVVLDYEATGTK